MNKSNFFKNLHSHGIISDDSLNHINVFEVEKPISVHWDLKTILYIGISLLSTGLGILVYKNIDTIGHQVILAFIALVAACCFYYCFNTKLPFSQNRVAAANMLSDYLLLLGSLTFITFIAYLQYQYNVFGNRYGLATFIPMLVLFFVAYFFDHIGILCLAVTNLGAWLGITVTPMHLWQSNDFSNSHIIFTGIALGLLLLALAYVSIAKNFKKHFAFTYENFGAHALFVSLLAAMFHFENYYLIWFLIFAVFAWYQYSKAETSRSFYFLAITVLYSYIALCYVVAMLLDKSHYNLGLIYLSIIYYIGSAIGLVIFLMRTNKKFRK